MKLRYGINPHQEAGPVTPVTPGRWPVRLVHGEPSFINMLDALNGWQLVHEARRILGRPAAASFKHVSPAGAAVSGTVDEVTAELHGITGREVGALASAYLRARDADPKSSYGDFAAVSHPVDAELTELLTGMVCDGIVAPGYAPGTVERLRRKKSGRFLIMEADEKFVPPELEARDVFGLHLTQRRDEVELSPALLRAVDEVPPDAAVADLLLGLAVLRHTQSNSVCYLRDGVTLGIGAGQQSRVDCTRLAGAKADTWWLRRHPAVRALSFRPGVRRQERINWQIRFIEGDLTPDEHRRLGQALTVPAGELSADDRAQWIRRLDRVAFASDGALPFRDNVDHAHRHGVRYIAEPGGSVRSGEVEEACREHGIVLARTGLRLFQH
ncbi:phosphoribosylaminoimidazolecarboxamide formyltransferase [Streptomyces sp. NPDC093970]|uniref:phosphoribosylaminoimidazolecarboxamide formyltransferase n=1 Tax=Streptomyces sp. NPDC093970 TaxID=3155076 RepID=UPI00343D6C28